MSNGMERPDQRYEGSLVEEGGNFIYKPKNETDPAKILSDAKEAIAARGGYHTVGKPNLFVEIPGRGSYNFDEHTTVETLDNFDETKRARKEVLAAIRGLTPEQMREVAAFAKQLERDE